MSGEKKTFKPDDKWHDLEIALSKIWEQAHPGKPCGTLDTTMILLLAEKETADLQTGTQGKDSDHADLYCNRCGYQHRMTPQVNGQFSSTSLLKRYKALYLSFLTGAASGLLFLVIGRPVTQWILPDLLQSTIDQQRQLIMMISLPLSLITGAVASLCVSFVYSTKVNLK